MRNVILFSAIVFAFSARAQSVTEHHQVNTWFGQGSDSLAVVVDFQIGNSSFVWGVLFDDSISGSEAVEIIELHDPAFSTTVSGGFLSDLCWSTFCGLGGSPDYWSTWSGDEDANWESNLGLATMAYPGEWFGLSYTDFNPALEPNTPVNSTVSLAELNNSKLVLSPNPTDAYFTIDAPFAPSIIELLDGMGHVIDVIEFRSKIDVSRYVSGIYFVRMRYADGTELTRRISIL